MKKLFGCILSLVMAVMLVFTPAEHVYAQGLGLSVSSSSVAVGKTDINTETTTVTFRNVSDDKNVVVAEMIGSERANITLNP